VDVGDVLADHAEHHQLDAADQGHDHNDRRPAWNVVEPAELHDQAPEREHEAQHRDEKAHPERKPQRGGGEADDPGGCEAKHLPEWILRLAGEPLFTLVEHARLAQADPAEHAAHEAVALSHALEDVEDAAVDEAEIADVERDLHLRDPIERAVEPRGRGPLEPGLARAHVANRVDDVIAFAPLLRELENHLGGVLEIGIEDDHRFADGEVDARGQRDLVAEVPRQLHELEARISCSDLEHELVGAIGAPIVDENRLRLRIEGIHQRSEARGQQLDYSFLVVGGDDE
jgi:hypothetical protein